MSSEDQKMDVSAESLGSIFQKGFDLHDEILDSSEDFRSDGFQNKVKKAILLLEDATRFVSMLDLFSQNETVEEVSTTDLKYFLLPAFLADLTGKIFDPAQDRAEIINVIEAYLRDFLQRTNDYGITEVKIPSQENGEDDTKQPTTRTPAQYNASREEKIRKYKEQKELEAKLSEMKVALKSPNTDEEIVRDFYLSLIKKTTMTAVDDLHSFVEEKGILAHMKMLREKNGGRLPPPPPEDAKKKSRPLKPIVITRDAVQKEVFGQGYKNLPILTIEEFYEQRVRDGWFPDPEKVKEQNSLQNMCERDINAEEEEEERRKEELEEKDDEEELQRKRNWDEYTDEHKRGEGNRHNKG